MVFDRKTLGGGSFAASHFPFMAAMSPVLTVQNLKVSSSKADLVENVSFSVRRGETLCLVGESGCGKSLTCMSILGLLDNGLQTSGSIELLGQETVNASEATLNRFRGDDVTVIFQNPMAALNPIQRVGRQILEGIYRHSELRGAEAERHMEQLLDQVGIPSVKRSKNLFPHQLSGGMCQRIMIAMALACKPKLLIADEPTTALDVTIQAQILQLIRDLQAELDLAVIFVTHDLGVVAEIADQVAVMYSGRIVETGPVADLFDHAAHPYTKALMNSRIGFDRPRGTKLEAIEGTVPSPMARPEGCTFAPRCAQRAAICTTTPQFQQARCTNVACHLTPSKEMAAAL